MGLAERKVKTKYMPDPSNMRWSKDSTGVGHRLLASQGWTPQTGLGATGQGIIKPLAAAIKFDSKGVGAQQKSDDWSWTGGEMFGDILARLNTSKIIQPISVVAASSVQVDLQTIVKDVVAPIRNASRAKYRAAKSGARSVAPESINLMLGITSKSSSTAATPVVSPLIRPPVASTSKLPSPSDSGETVEAQVEELEEEVVAPQKNSSNLSVAAYFKLKMLETAAKARGEVFVPPAVVETASPSAPILGEEAAAKGKYGPAPEQRKVEGERSHMKFSEESVNPLKRKSNDEDKINSSIELRDETQNKPDDVKETKEEKRERKRLKKLKKENKS